MALRIVDIYRAAGSDPLELPDNAYDVLGHWTHTLDDDRRVDRVLIDAEETESLMEWVDTSAGGEAYRIVLQAVEATLPTPEPDAAGEAEAAGEDAAEAEPTVGRISREELYQEMVDAISVSPVHYALVVLSVLVAAGGMLRNDTAVVIGAMVIAPLIGPNIALALGSTLADGQLLRRAARVNVVGLVLGLVVSVGLGLLLSVDPGLAELAARTRIGLSDIALALASGVAGALSTTRSVSTSLIGVMVAVALVPPLVAAGLLVGQGAWPLAYRALLLLTTNVVCINLAAVVTFLVQGIRPMTWYDARRARTSTRWAIGLWTAALLILAAAILLSKGWPIGG
jgi:uncharacterized hydrophobic protein (TIGR00341 family)